MIVCDELVEDITEIKIQKMGILLFRMKIYTEKVPIVKISRL